MVPENESSEARHPDPWSAAVEVVAAELAAARSLERVRASRAGLEETRACVSKLKADIKTTWQALRGDEEDRPDAPPRRGLCPIAPGGVR
jgi:hypothetical protein